VIVSELESNPISCFPGERPLDWRLGDIAIKNRLVSFLQRLPATFRMAVCALRRDGFPSPTLGTRFRRKSIGSLRDNLPEAVDTTRSSDHTVLHARLDCSRTQPVPEPSVVAATTGIPSVASCRIFWRRRKAWKTPHRMTPRRFLYKALPHAFVPLLSARRT